MKRLRLRFLLAAAVLSSFPSLISTAHAQAVPNAGGYAGDFGSDFGVGRATPKGIREPVVVAGVRSTVNGKNVPWLGVRFADELAQQLRAPMRKSADASGVAQFLAARRIASWQVAPDPASAAPSAAHALHTWPAYRAIPLVIVGEIALSGKENAPSTSLRIRLRALRWEKSTLHAASADVLLSATLGEWPQLPSRAALSLLDALQVPLIEDERTVMLRDASPLQPPATALRLRAERLAGQMQYQALRCQFLSQAVRGEQAFARVTRVRTAKAYGDAARQALTALKKLKLTGDAVTLRETPSHWQAYVFSVSRAANTRFQALPVAWRKTLPAI